MAQSSRHADAESTAESTTDEMIDSDRENTAATILAMSNVFGRETGKRLSVDSSWRDLRNSGSLLL